MRTARLLATLKLAALPLALPGQLEFNASASFELSGGGDKSHYYYNEIHEDYRGWRAGLWLPAGNCRGACSWRGIRGRGPNS